MLVPSRIRQVPSCSVRTKIFAPSEAAKEASMILLHFVRVASPSGYRRRGRVGHTPGRHVLVSASTRACKTIWSRSFSSTNRRRPNLIDGIRLATVHFLQVQTEVPVRRAASSSEIRAMSNLRGKSDPRGAIPT